MEQLLKRLASRGLSLIYTYEAKFDVARATGPLQYRICLLPITNGATEITASGDSVETLLADMNDIPEELLDQVGKPWEDPSLSARS